MQSIKASPEGLRKIRQAREERGWAIDRPEWLEEASSFLPMVKNGKTMMPTTVSIGTWKRFLAGKAIKSVNFKAFCQVLELNWEEVVEREEAPSRKKTVVTSAQGLIESIFLSGISGCTLKLWDESDGKCLFTLHGYDDSVYSVTLNPGATTLTSSSDDNTINFSDISDGKYLLTLQAYTQSMSFAFSPDSKILASDGHNGKIDLGN